MSYIIFYLTLLAVFFNTAAQLVLKVGMNKIGVFDFSWANIIPITLKVIFSPLIALGIFIYVGSVFVWLMVLSRAPVSVAYPMSSLGYVTSTIAACYFLGENLSILRITGIFVILVGVYMVAKG